MDEIAAGIPKLAVHIHAALEKLLAGEMSLEAAKLSTRQAEALLGLWSLEADLLRRQQARKQ